MRHPFLFAGLLAAFLAVPLRAVDPTVLQQVKRVYLLPMTGGLDQHIANRITREGIYEVVADPKMADAILTDRIGEPFEQRLDELYPKPAAKPVEPPKPVAPPTTDKAASNDANRPMNLIAEPFVRAGGFSRSRGNVFLVNVQSRQVLWSVYSRPKGSTPDELNKTADRIVDRLRDDRSRKPKATQP